MAVEITGKYIGNLKTELTHGPSGAVIRTAAPVDNQGDGSSFSPTDLAASALGVGEVSLAVVVAAANPRRIGAIPVTITMPAGLTVDQKKKLENAAMTCPVHKSLSEDVERPVEFVYADAPVAVG